MNKSAIESIKEYVRAANYISASQIYLQSNFFLERKLTFDDIKSRLLGHWGTCPGINFVYANLNYLIKKHSVSTLFVLGPGHGFPALQANLFLEGTLAEFYPSATQNEAGLAYLCKNFSWPYGFPSHCYPGTPGAILEGGELGYALSTAYGAALDNPHLLVACLVGDGEAETGPTATAWHLSKFLDPKTNGTVLPILHLNGYKISGPTIFGRMTNKELRSLFYGYGYTPLIVEAPSLYEKMAAALERAYRMIQEIKHADQKQSFQRLPMIILKTPKGWTGIKKLHHQKIEGNALSHQVVVTKAKSDKEELRALEKWLKSYHFSQVYSPSEGLKKDIIATVLPAPDLRMGKNKHAYTREIYKDLVLPDPQKFAEPVPVPGTVGSSSMRRAGLYLNEVVALNAQERNFRFFSPDETYSNKLDALFQSTKRAFMLPLKSWDKDLAPDGRVIEMLSEHSLQGLAEGYILTGRHAVFTSYEAFIEIISSMADQYVKFLKVAQEFPWRGPYSSLNYILTSSGWRQEHNGFSHQNPAFIGGMLEKHCEFVKAYFPADGNSTLVCLKTCLASKNGINIITAGKTLEPRWLTIEAAQRAQETGLMIWDFASDKNPDIVFVAIGDYLTKEALAAIDALKTLVPQVHIRFVNILVLTGITEPTACLCTAEEFLYYFTPDKPVIINYHGYPEIIKAMLFNQAASPHRFMVNGYIQEGSTTTPFDMQIRNQTSRYHLILQAATFLSQTKVITKEKAAEITALYTRKIKENTEYIKKYGVDPQEIENWQWTRTTSSST